MSTLCNIFGKKTWLPVFHKKRSILIADLMYVLFGISFVTSSVTTTNPNCFIYEYLISWNKKNSTSDKAVKFFSVNGHCIKQSSIDFPRSSVKCESPCSKATLKPWFRAGLSMFWETLTYNLVDEYL